MHAWGEDIVSVELPRGWTVTVGARDRAVGFCAVYAASCGGQLRVTLDRGTIVYEAEGLRAVDEATVAARTFLHQLRTGTLRGRVACPDSGRQRRR